MTPQEILAGLRDIHLPADTIEAGPQALAIWPFLAFVGLVLAIVGVRWFRAGAWRRAAYRHLSEIERDTDAVRRREALFDLMRRLASHTDLMPLPSAVFKAPESIDPSELDALAAHIRRRIGG